MKKLFFGLTFLIILIIGSIYTLLFTKLGNNYIASYIENKVNNEQTNVKLKVNDFTLTLNTINFDASIDDNSNINISGDLQLLSKVVNLKYNVKVKELSNLEKLMGQKLNGPFFTSGTFKGNQQLSIIQGLSDMASSKTNYKVELANFEPKNINFKIANAKIEELLNLLNQPIYSQGILNLSGEIPNAKVGSLEGNIITNISKGKIVNDVINKQFNQKITTSINYDAEVSSKLSGNNIELKSALLSSLADVTTQKTLININTNNISSDYEIDIKNLANFESIIGTKLNGEFSTNGNIEIANNDIKINGKSNIFTSDTSYDLLVKNSILKDINFKIQNAKIDKLLHFANEPVYAIGDLNIDGKISNAVVENLDGVITTKISNARVINEVVNTVFKQNLKDKVSFSGVINTKLIPYQVVSNANIKTTLANLNTKNTVFDIKNASLNSDYLLNVFDLNKLKDITGTKMRGKIDINGVLKSKTNSLYVDGNSKLLGGALDFVLNNDNLTANVKEVQVKQLTHMLYYPETFDSKTDLKLVYNTLNKKGKLTGNLLNGHFLPNDFSLLINQLAKFDLTREIYEAVAINSDINNMVLKTIINMKSKNTTIDVTSSTLDLEKSTIDAQIAGKIKTTEFGVKVKGTTSNPKITLDTKSLLKNQIEKQLDKGKVKEKLDKALGKDGADLLKNFKSLF